MKKIILLILLIGIVYFVGTKIIPNTGFSDQKAQALWNETSQPVNISLINKRYTISTKNNFIYLVGDFMVKSSQAGNMTYISSPKILKDGADFTSSTTSTQFSGWKMKKIGVFGYTPFKNTMFSTTTFSPDKGASYYRFAWAIDKRTLPEGSYQFSFSTYSNGTATTSTSSTNLVPLNTPWTKSVKVSPGLSDRLNNTFYKLVRYEGVPYTGSSTPTISFSNGQIKAKICQTEHTGNYQLAKNFIVSSSLPKQASCSDSTLSPMEKNFLFQIPFGLDSSFNGEFMTLKGRAGGKIIEYIFIRYYPTTGTLETSLPMLTSISTTTAKILSSVNITGSNFATSNVILFTPISSTLGLPVVVARVATSSANGITFTVPTNSICENGTTTCGTTSAITPGLYKVQIKTPAGTSSGSFTLVVTQ